MNNSRFVPNKATSYRLTNSDTSNNVSAVNSWLVFFYRAMHYSARHGLAIACRLSVRPSVRDVGGSGRHTLEIFEINCMDN